MTEKRKILGPLEWLALLIGVGIIGYITLKSGNFRLFERTEDVSFIDPDKTARPAPPRPAPSESEAEIDRMLREMAGDFNRSEDRSESLSEKESMSQKWGLSEEEADFYQKIKENYQLDKRVKSASDWFKLLRYSQQTYSKVQDLFEELSPDQSPNTRPEQVLENEAAADNLYSRLYDWYGLSSEEIDDFVEKGKNSLEDWALFISQHKEGEK